MVALLGIALFLLGMLLVLTAGIWGVILAFYDSTAWGLLCLLVPFAAFVFIAKNWGRQAVRNSFSLSLIGLLALMGGSFVIVTGGRSLVSQITPTNLEGDEFLGDRLPEENLNVGSDTSPNAIDSPNSTTTTTFSQNPSDANTPSVDSPDSTTPTPFSQNPSDANTPSVGDPLVLPAGTSREDYHQTMMVGYDAYNDGHYQTALINFRRALDIKPGDRLATEAIQNTELVIQRQQASKEGNS